MNDLQWVLICAGLVFLMQPGFMCLESGLTRSKNNINVAIKNLADFGISVMLFWAFGYAIMFGLSWQGWFGFSGFILDIGDDFELGAFFLFQVMFCSTTTTIVSGAVAERLKFSAYVIISIITSGLIYPFFGHWVWNGLGFNDDYTFSGWLGKLGFIDFAGCSVVHSIGAWIALALLLIIGPRQGRFSVTGYTRKMNGSNLSLSVLGVMLLWIGWFGFNGGSAFSFETQVAKILVNTLMSGVAGMISGCAFGWHRYKLPEVELLINGTIAGLVSITACCHLVSTPQAVVIGSIGAYIMLWCKDFLERKHIDDAVDAIAVHGGAGMWGVLAVALFVPTEKLATGLSSFEQFLVQLLGIGVSVAWGFGVSWLILSIINRFLPFRVCAEDERIGLNISEHGAKTDLYDLLTTMNQQATSQDLSLRVPVEPFTEVGYIASHYNQVIDSLEKSSSQLEQGNKELAVAKEKAEVANKTKSIFLANMSHELRTPMNAILGFSQIMMRSNILPAEHLENVSIINRSGNYLLNLINNILDLSKIEAGKISRNAKDFDLYSLIEEVENLLRLKAETQQLQLNFYIASDVPRYINTDETKIRQVLINLINNGLKFTQQGGVSVTVTVMNQNSQNDDNLSVNQIKVLFKIEDTGVGIAPSEISKIFEAFTQTEVGRNSREGTGLGLAISRKFVQLMGGDINVESQLEEGSTFSFDVTATIVESLEINIPESPKSRRVIGLQSGQPIYRILIVDDCRVNRLLLVKILKPLGFELQEAENGVEAINIWQEWKPHLIWMDMRMPVMDGYEATQYIKSTTKGNATAIIALTASVLEEEKAVILSAGCDDFIRKPFQESVIFDAMGRHLGVKYIYQEKLPQNNLVSNQIITKEDLQIMSKSWLNQLYQASIDLDDDLILELIKQIPTQYDGLASQLTQLVNNFQLVKIRKLIE